MNPPDSTTAARPSPGIWPWIVVGLLVTHVIGMGIVVYVAVGDPSFATEPDYYQKALAWDETASERRAEHELGWLIHLSVASFESPLHDRAVRVMLYDRDGSPIGDAQVEAEAFPHARSAERTTLQFTPEQNAYGATLRVSRTGTWEFRLRIQALGQTVASKQVVQIETALGERG